MFIFSPLKAGSNWKLNWSLVGIGGLAFLIVRSWTTVSIGQSEYILRPDLHAQPRPRYTLVPWAGPVGGRCAGGFGRLPGVRRFEIEAHLRGRGPPRSTIPPGYGCSCSYGRGSGFFGQLGCRCRWVFDREFEFPAARARKARLSSPRPGFHRSTARRPREAHTSDRGLDPKRQPTSEHSRNAVRDCHARVRAHVDARPLRMRHLLRWNSNSPSTRHACGHTPYAGSMQIKSTLFSQR